MTGIRTRAAVGALAAALLLAPTLSGCGQAAEEVAEQAAEQAVGGDVEIDDNNVTVTDDEGNEMAIGESVSIPDTWPAEVPLFEGGTLVVVAVQSDGVYATWQAEGTAEEVADSYGANLEAAGYTLESDANAAGSIFREYLGNGYQIQLATAEAEGETSLIVTATPEG